MTIVISTPVLIADSSRIWITPSDEMLPAALGTNGQPPRPPNALSRSEKVKYISNRHESVTSTAADG